MKVEIVEDGMTTEFLLGKLKAIEEITDLLHGKSMSSAAVAFEKYVKEQREIAIRHRIAMGKST